MNKTFQDLEKPSRFLIAPHSQKYNVQHPNSPSCFCLSQDPCPTTSTPMQPPPSAFSGIQSSQGLQPQNTHPMPITKPYSLSLTFVPIWENSATSSSSSITNSTNPSVNKLEPQLAEDNHAYQYFYSKYSWLLFSPFSNGTLLPLLLSILALSQPSMKKIC